MKKLLFSVSLISMGLAASAKVEPASIIGDNMVIQQQTDVHLWGNATPGAELTVSPSWSGVPVKGKVGADGKWEISIPTPAASFTPQTLTISDGTPLTIKDVLIGEVWLASGQSNMEMPLKGFGGCNVEGGTDEIASSRKWADKVRFFTVPLSQSYQPLDTVDARWTVPGPDTASDYSATAWYFATRLSEVLDVPVGIVNCSHGGARVESWLPREILKEYPDVSLDEKDIEAMTHYIRPMVMYNAMFNPIKGYTVNGILWYQGCSNVGKHEEYAPRLARMVEHWRNELGRGDLPFYSVEIAPYDYDSPDQDNKSAYLREAQWKSLDLIPNSAMIGTNDLVKPYERFNIHPGNKSGVGHRLASLALNKKYGKKQFMCESPKYKSHKVKGNEVWVAIDSKENGICRNYDIRGFEVAGADKKFYPADNARLNWQTNEIVVSSDKVPAPVAVRYCFNDFEIGTLYGGDWLPLIPFRSDNWE